MWLLVVLHLATFRHFCFNAAATCDRVGVSMESLVPEDEGPRTRARCAGCARVREEAG